MTTENTIADILDTPGQVSPADCYSAHFKRAHWGGYRPDEVDAFLARTAETLEYLLLTTTQHAAELERLREVQAAHKELESALREALVSAQKASELTLEHAHREASALLEEARLAKLRIEQEAALFPHALRKEIDELSALRSRLRRDLRIVLDNHAAFLEGIPFAEERDVHMPGDTGHDLDPATAQIDLPHDGPSTSGKKPPAGFALDDPAWLRQDDAITDDKDILE